MRAPGHIGGFLRRAAALIMAAAALTASGCARILETERLTVTPHADLSPPPHDNAIPEASDYAELRGAVYDILSRGQNAGRINVFEYSGELEPDLERAREDILLRDAFGSYALSDISYEITPIVSYYEVSAELTYRRSGEQLDAVVTASTQLYLRTELLEMMSAYREDAAILTGISGISGEQALEYINEIYYENPLRVVMLPIATAVIYPPETSGGEKLIELTFGYSQSTSVLTRFSEWLRSAARDIAESATGDGDGELLLSLCRSLAELAEYDSAAAALTEYPTQGLSSTAYGALLGGSAIGEGYAMAYKALCDSLSLQCIVVPGTRGGQRHAWNIVVCDGAYYHIDPAMCDTEGYETAFLKSDEDMEAMQYEWDRDAFPVCGGDATYEQLVS
ncbi:MAG: hypothetical protein LBH17_01315 [Oscillospiraceae bacterium]|jgi:hypothetical protein|nr:hypothetical protein [Oscillospiraceae bacterium]